MLEMIFSLIPLKVENRDTPNYVPSLDVTEEKVEEDALEEDILNTPKMKIHRDMPCICSTQY